MMQKSYTAEAAEAVAAVEAAETIETDEGIIVLWGGPHLFHKNKS